MLSMSVQLIRERKQYDDTVEILRGITVVLCGLTQAVLVTSPYCSVVSIVG